MQLLVIRHAIAMDKVEFARTGKTDDLRPLTDEGRERMRIGARGLREIVPQMDALATSPWVRAVQTADIVAREYGGMQPVRLDQLIPEHPPSEITDWLRTVQRAKVVAIVGHEPHLTELVSWCLTDREDPFLTLKKGGVCLLEFDGKIRGGGAVLNWALTPWQLRRFAS